MKIRNSWIKIREPIFVSIFFDAIIFSYFINSYVFSDLGFIHNFFFLPSIMFIWILPSYVLGRYYDISSKKKFNLATHILKTFCNSLISILCLLIILFLYDADLNQFQNINRFCFNFSIFLISSIFFQRIIHYFYSQSLLKQNYWIFIGNKVIFKEFKKQIRTGNFFGKIEFSESFEKSISRNEDKIAGFILADKKFLTNDEFMKLISKQSKTLKIENINTWFENQQQRFPADFFDEDLLLNSRFSFAYSSLDFRLKRLGDIIVSVVLIFLSTPIIFLAGLFIFLEDRGPIFYKQIRTGYNGNTYTIVKLRTMKIDAENNGIKWATKQDNRITKVGSILRNTRIDELPQLFSVLIGSMSLIGPRPERPELDESLEKLIPNYQLRYKVRPGLSGWAQVNYPYGSSIQDSSNKLSYDLFYIKNSSFWLDLIIFFKTIKIVFNAKGT